MGREGAAGPRRRVDSRPAERAGIERWQDGREERVRNLLREDREEKLGLGLYTNLKAYSTVQN